LILFVAVSLFLRSFFFSKKDAGQANKNEETQNQSVLQYKGISSQDLLKKISSREEITIIDIRDPESFKYEHILDSQNVPLADLEILLPSLEKDTAYLLVDDLGLTSEETQFLQIFSEIGFTRVAYLEGGLFDWKNQSGPTVTLGDPRSFTDQAKVTLITSDELKNALINEPRSYILDLRERKEFDKAHIKNAVNINFEDMEEKRDEIPFGKKIILYDNNGILAFQGAVKLFDMGIFNVYALSDGLLSWKEKGFTTEPSR